MKGVTVLTGELMFPRSYEVLAACRTCQADTPRRERRLRRETIGFLLFVGGEARAGGERRPQLAHTRPELMFPGRRPHVERGRELPVIEHRIERTSCGQWELRSADSNEPGPRASRIRRRLELEHASREIEPAHGPFGSEVVDPARISRAGHISEQTCGRLRDRRCPCR